MFADEVARRYVEAIDKKDPSGFAALFADGAVLHDPFFPEPTKGRDAIRAMIEGILRAFPDMTWEQVGDPIEAGGRAALVMGYPRHQRRSALHARRRGAAHREGDLL